MVYCCDFFIADMQGSHCVELILDREGNWPLFAGFLVLARSLMTGKMRCSTWIGEMKTNCIAFQSLFAAREEQNVEPAVEHKHFLFSQEEFELLSCLVGVYSSIWVRAQAQIAHVYELHKTVPLNSR